MAATSLQIPQISQAEMTAFHDAHFSNIAADHFQAHFLRPDHPPAENITLHAADDEEYYEEDDGLGYYPDGVKRTLTDEQIAIFRHSELEALRRAKESPSNKKVTTTNPDDDTAQSMSEDGEVPSAPSATAKKSKKRKRGKPNNNKHRNGEEPIDLRKRTWDVVDKGLATLDYGEENNEPAEASAIQRRRISYDD